MGRLIQITIIALSLIVLAPAQAVLYVDTEISTGQVLAVDVPKDGKKGGEEEEEEEPDCE